jgi:hypothetical protein
MYTLYSIRNAPERALNKVSAAQWEGNYGVNRMLETYLIYLTFRRIHTLKISLREMRTPELSTGG